MRKWIGIVLILTSFFFLGIGGYQYFEMNSKQDEALRTAQSIVHSAQQDASERGDLESILRDFEPDNGDAIGILSIPILDDEWPIVVGTSDEDLKAGVGHYIGTAFPGQGRQILLSGHRDTVFRNLGDLVVGDIIEVQMGYGTFKYEIHEEPFIVPADDRTVIDYSIDEEVLTISTCYPFRFIGDAPDRYIINAKPVNE
ncbi:class D sortase [Evansella sp. AB-P1]|uniref:class D sortase n=1 Tax=Evansella sp. AB-P1 TaxID=3037653 RepID=UPI00241FB522|nr:class D sortase [Evansella sp. AB-P1]MDG5786707.1 class D sortase [Evansella sp. AB-P1]